MTTIQDPLNSGQTPTMANFATLADVLAGCATRVTADACGKLIAAATPPTRRRPTDTLTAAQSIAKYPWYQPGRVFALLDAFYPVPQGKTMRPVPYMPYLSFSPSAWVLPLKFDGGGYRAGGKAMFDSEGNLWVGDNFTVGWQAQDTLWQGNATKFAPNGKPLSPITTGFVGGGMQGGTFGAAVDAKDNAWFSSYGGKSIAVFDKNGKPLTPPEGITFNGQLGLDAGHHRRAQRRRLGVGDLEEPARALPQGRSGPRAASSARADRGAVQVVPRAVPPRHRSAGPDLGVEWRWRPRHAILRLLTRARWRHSRPVTAEAGSTSTARATSGSRTGSVAPSGERWPSKTFQKIMGTSYDDEFLVRTMYQQQGGADGGSVTLLRPDGTQYPGSPFTGGGLPGPWAVVVDGNDNVWISNFAMASSPIVQLCGVRTENCPPGMKTGDQISPPGGYVGGGLQMQTDIAISPAGDVWAMNNWQDIDSCFPGADEALSTLCGGQGVVIFFGMAKPVRAPQIGPARPY